MQKSPAYARVRALIPIRRTHSIRFGAESEWTFDNFENYAGFLSEDLNRFTRRVIAKEDGTLPDDRGVEVVTRPYRWTHTRALIGRITETATRRDLALQSSDAIHVHVSRLRDARFFRSVARLVLKESDMHTQREREERSHALSFVYAKAAFSDPSSQDFWDAVACAPEMNLRRRYVTGSWSDAWALASDAEWITHPEHGQAVSWSVSEPTIEFRAFRTTRFASVNKSYLDCVHALLAFGRAQTRGYGNDDGYYTPPQFRPEEFAEFVIKQNGYRFLSKRFLTAKPSRVIARRRALHPQGAPTPLAFPPAPSRTTIVANGRDVPAPWSQLLQPSPLECTDPFCRCHVTLGRTRIERSEV